MNTVDSFMSDLKSELNVRGRPRRRLLAECRDHLVESAAARGPEEAVRRFGDPADLARAFDTEMAGQRAVRATVVSVAGVLCVGLSTLMMVNAADSQASAPVAWAVMFFACAQVAAASLALGVLRAVVIRAEAGTPDDYALLCRRNATALTFALLTMFAAGGAVPGQTAAWKIVTGPLVAMIATGFVVRARSLARALGPGNHVVRSPLPDAGFLARWNFLESARFQRPSMVLVPTVLVAMVAAFAWNALDHGSMIGSVQVACVEAGLVISGFVFLGRNLGLHGATPQADAMT